MLPKSSPLLADGHASYILSFSLSLSVPPVCLSFCLSVCLSFPSVCLSACLSVCLSFPTVCLSVCHVMSCHVMSCSVCVCLFDALFCLFCFVCLFVCLLACLSCCLVVGHESTSSFPPPPPVDSSTTPILGLKRSLASERVLQKSPAQAVVLYMGAPWDPILRARENLCPSLVARLVQHGLVLGATDAQRFSL